MTTTFRLLAALTCLVVGAETAWAHAHLERAQPGADASTRQPPGEVRLWFTQALEAGLSEVSVLDDQARRVDKKDTRLDPTDAKVMIVSLPALPAGTYKVVWKAVSVDGHTSRGDYQFTIAPSA